MRQIKNIAVIDLKIVLKDKLFLFWTLIFPFAFIIMFGSFYKDTDSKTELLIINKDKGKWGTYFIEQLKDPGILIKTFKKKPKTFNRILIIPEDFSKKILLKKTQDLILLKNEGSSIKAAAHAETKIIQAIVKIITELILNPDIHTFFEKKEDFKNIIELESGFPEGTIAKVPSGYDHVIPGVLVQFIMIMILIYGGISVMIDRQKGRLLRILFSSTSIPGLWAGKFIGRLFLGIIQAAILIVFGMIFFHFNLGNVFLSCLTIFLFIILNSSLSILLGSVIKKEEIIVGTAILLSNIFAALGGCWWPIEIVSDTLKSIGMLVPAYWAMDALHKIIFFNKEFADISINFIVLILFTLTFSLISFKFFKIKE